MGKKYFLESAVSLASFGKVLIFVNLATQTFRKEKSNGKNNCTNHCSGVRENLPILQIGSLEIISQLRY